MKKRKLLTNFEINFKKPNFDPLISALGVKININTVNIRKTPLHFYSRRVWEKIHGCESRPIVNIQKQPRRGLGMSKLTNRLVNKSQRIHSIVKLGSFMI